MKILKTVQKVPGGLMVVPLLLGATVNTLFPQALTIGGFTSAIFKTGTATMLAYFCLCNGAQISVKQAAQPLIKGASLTIFRLLLGVTLGGFVGHFFGAGGILGITPLALIAAMTNANGGLFAALAGEYGDSSDVGAISITTLMDGPFFTMVALGFTGTAKIPIMTFIACLVPIVIGFVLGNLDKDLQEFLEKGATLPIPFFAFSLGAGLNFGQIIKAGLPGIVLGLSITIIAGFGGYFIMKYLIRSKYPAVGAAIGTTAGNAVATPAAIAAVDSSFNSVAAIATVQVAASVIITAILCPILVTYLSKKANNSIKKDNESVSVNG